MKRSWAQDRGHLTAALDKLGHDANPNFIPLVPPPRRSPLWLLIFPEGTIASDEEREKSVNYAKRENIVSTDSTRLSLERLHWHAAP
jgi:lysocardiolipin and lysophospholipid acyltransferase